MRRSLIALAVGATLAGGVVLPASATASTWTVTSLTDGSAGTSGSLRWALDQASSGDTITFAPSLFNGGPGTLTLTDGQIGVYKSVTIDGPGSGQLTIDGANGTRVMDVGFAAGAPGTVTIEGVTLAHGNSGAAGGGALQSSNTNLTLTDVVVSDSTAVNAGGGVLLTNGGTSAPLTYSLSHVTISGNSVTGYTFQGGGGLSVAGGCTACSNAPDTLAITDSTLSGNAVLHFRGGGMVAEKAAITATRIIVSGNSSASVGGGVSLSTSATLQLTASAVSGNVATGYGGGVHLDSATGSSVSTTTFSANEAGGGGALSVLDAPATGTFTVARSTFIGNTAGGDGGAIFYYNPRTAGSGGLLLVDDTFDGNTAESWGAL